MGESAGRVINLARVDQKPVAKVNELKAPADTRKELRGSIVDSAIRSRKLSSSSMTKGSHSWRREVKICALE
jgi:hypothetical protein